MILTVTLNAALDITYTVPSLVPGAAHRVLGVSQRAGGKGINVARVLHALGHPVLATGLAGGAVLDGLAVPHSFSPISNESRRTVTVVGDGEATLFNEPGPEVSAAEWQAFVDHFRSLAREATVVVLSGSMPPGVPPDGYAHLVSIVDCKTIVDTSGVALEHAIAARPDVVKPNADELREATGHSSPQAGASALLRGGARAVVASLGPEGLLAVTEHESWRLAPPGALAGNPTGAGDACVAGIAAGLHTAAAWPAILREAVALSAAAVLHPVAGGFDVNAYEQLRASLPLARKAL
ncbi:1-phosphofructokinase family hexose kinase [Allokutzneria sp. A3M-2-11 16]|uniref:1-phosphofructokinase family hexose kinase n=1 Tax=Allokutzneria sp. A3M-2-11 16 TaxID=2962043 RepID=UPI0020B796DB|nr:1-phosphofructokinase family hexose kinase [Allokutzneria sp. A3M-2-11 16]MCP3805242.1 1-phosphofructokinase family hexose kinase [Allokutzneria sp. A3M-2-11 16]